MAPTTPETGVNDDTVGTNENVNPDSLTTPRGVVTRTTPVTAPSGTTAVICVDEFTVNIAAAPEPTVSAFPSARPNHTSVAPCRFDPVITTGTPDPAFTGVKLVIAERIPNEPAATEVTPAAVTDTAPEPAPAGTTTVNTPSLLTVGTAVTAPEPANVTRVAPKKPEPVIVTVSPTAPLMLRALSTTGPARTSIDPDSATPSTVVTVTGPSTAPSGTTTVNPVAVNDPTDASTAPSAPVNDTTVDPVAATRL